MEAAIAVLRGRVAEALGHDMDALDNYRHAVESPDRAAAAEAKLDEIALRQKREELSPADALRGLETLAVMCRGDLVEGNTMEMPARNYADTARHAEPLPAT